MKKTLITVLAVILAASLGIVGTLAWLFDETDPIVNTFTIGTLSAELYETKDGAPTEGGLEYEGVSPGQTLHKDPTIVVNKDAWLYIGVHNPNGDKITFTPNEDWQKIGTKTIGGTEYDIYAMENLAKADTPYTLFNNVKISEAATNETELEDITVIGFAVQFEAGSTAAAAWNATFGKPTT